MKFGKIVINFIGTFILVLIVSSVVSFFWNLIFYGTGQFDWETSFRLAIIFGIVIPWIMAKDRNKKEN